jgi:phage terminase small subunit
MALPDRHRRFAEEYLVDLNATQAAIRAGYSEKTARAQGSRLLTNVDVLSAIEDGKAKRAAKVEITAERVLREIARVALLDPRKLFDESGNLKSPTELDDDTAAVLSSLEVFEEFAGRGELRESIGTTRKIKLWDKVSALTLLSKHLGLISERHEHSGPGGGPIESRVIVIPDNGRADRQGSD